MAQNNTTLMYIILSELIEAGFNEFEETNKIIFFDDDKQFIKKIMKYDSDVQIIVNEKVFQGESLKVIDHDIHFKKTFINKFLNRQIGRQTIEDFSTQVLYTFFLYEEYINLVYSDLDKYLTRHSENNVDGNRSGINDMRRLSSDLPRDNINLNVDDTILNYGNENTISRDKHQEDNQQSSISKSYNLDDLKNSKALLKPVFNEFDRNCFMQTF